MDYRCVAPLRSFFSCNDFLNNLPFLPWFGEMSQFAGGRSFPERGRECR